MEEHSCRWCNGRGYFPEKILWLDGVKLAYTVLRQRQPCLHCKPKKLNSNINQERKP